MLPPPPHLLTSPSTSTTTTTTTSSSSTSSSLSSSSPITTMEDVWKDITTLSSFHHHNHHLHPQSSGPTNLVLQNFLPTRDTTAAAAAVASFVFLPCDQTSTQTPPPPPPPQPSPMVFGPHPVTALSLNSSSEFHFQSVVPELPVVVTNFGGGAGGGPFDGFSPSPFLSSFGKKRFQDEAEEGSGDRRHKRMIKNRESAARSRARKQAYVNELEQENAQLVEENVRLRKHLQQQQELLLRQAPPAAAPPPPQLASPKQKPNRLQRTLTAPF